MPEIFSEKIQTMNYELAKKLKDAGFPRMDVIRDGEEFQLNAKSSQQGRYSDDDRDFHLDSDGVRLPTLSELIEACEDDTFELTKDDEKWIAVRNPELLGIEEVPEGIGSTPEEAVANLWLALNQPSR